MKFKDMPYERVNFEEVEAQFQELMKEFVEAKSGEEQFEVHKKGYALTDRINTLMTIANIRYDVNTIDEFYLKEKEYNDEIMPKLNNLVIEYQKKVFESPFRDYLEKKIGHVAFKNMEIAQKAFDEKLIPLMQEENTLTVEYDKLIASAKIDFDGKEWNLSLVRPYLVKEDRDIRINAWEKLTAFFDENREQLDTIFDQ